MSIPTLEHIIEAIRDAAHNYSGGVRAMAARMDMAPSSLGNALNPYGDRGLVKLGLEQAMFIMRESGDHAALHMMAHELGYALVPMKAEPDKGVEGEQLDDFQRLAELQRAILDKAPKDVRAILIGALIQDVAQTETAVQRQEEEDQKWKK